MARPNKNVEKKAAILAIAEKVFVKLGYAKTTLDDVANAAQLNKATLYHYFKSKDEIFFSVIASVMQKAFTTLQQVLIQPKTAQNKIQLFFNQRVQLYVTQLKINALSKEALLVLQPQFDALYAPYRAKEINLVMHLFAELSGNKKPAALKATTQHLFALLDAIKHDAIFFGNLLDDDKKVIAQTKKIVQQTVQLFIQNLKK
jgi:AcrR family transcriptional regulator